MMYPTVEMILAETHEGFRKELWPGDLDCALSFLYPSDVLQKAKQAAQPNGLRWARPQDLDPKDYIRFDGEGPYGWGKDQDPSRLAEKLSYKLKRPGYFQKLLEFKDKNQIPPVITINGQLADGAGRAHLFHALGLPVLAADFLVDSSTF